MQDITKAALLKIANKPDFDADFQREAAGIQAGHLWDVGVRNDLSEDDMSTIQNALYDLRSLGLGGSQSVRRSTRKGKVAPQTPVSTKKFNLQLLDSYAKENPYLNALFARLDHPNTPKPEDKYNLRYRMVDPAAVSRADGEMAYHERFTEAIEDAKKNGR